MTLSWNPPSLGKAYSTGFLMCGLMNTVESHLATSLGCIANPTLRSTATFCTTSETEDRNIFAREEILLNIFLLGFPLRYAETEFLNLGFIFAVGSLLAFALFFYSATK
jgi:hypothetical protein